MGVIYGLVSGDMDNAAIRVGSELRDTFEAAKSETLKRSNESFSDTLTMLTANLGSSAEQWLEPLHPPLATAFVLEQ